MNSYEYLSNDQLSAVLPNYKQIFYSIKDIRKDANELDQCSKEGYEHFPYKNIIGILGERGSGKTSFFNTLRALLNESDSKKLGEYIGKDNNIDEFIYNNDVHLKLIVPEKLEDSADILGVILLNIKALIDKNQAEIKRFYNHKEKNQENNNFNSCLNSSTGINYIGQKWENAFMAYLQRAEGFSEITKKNYTSLNDYSKERQKSLESEIEIGEKLYKLFTELSNIFSVHKKKSLIYIYIDDIDINRTRCGQAIRTILRYLKHPNVVVFISADIDRMEKILLIDEIMEEKSDVVSEIIGLENIKEEKEQYIYELLKKVLPYSNRYNLIKLSNKGKMDFKYPGEKEQGRNFKEIIQSFINLMRKKFIQNDEIIDIPESLYCIFDYKPRGIVTLWEYIERNFFLDEKDQNIDKDIHKFDSADYRNLLGIIINTNETLNSNKKIIEEQLISIIDDNNKLSRAILHINYDKFINIVINNIKSQTNNDDKSIKPKEFITILHLFYFMEVILQEDRTEGKVFSNLLNIILEVSDDKKIYFDTSEVETVLELYGQISQKIELDYQKSIFDNERYFMIYKDIINKQQNNQSIMDAANMDSMWKKNYDLADNKFNDNYNEIIEEIIELFTGIDYDQTLLEKDKKLEDYIVERSDE